MKKKTINNKNKNSKIDFNSNKNAFSFNQIHFEPEWEYENPATEFCYKSGVIPGKLFYSSLKGNINIGDVEKATKSLQNLYESGYLTDATFIRVVDYTEVKKTSLSARKHYARTLNELNKKYNCQPEITYICGADLFTKSSLRVFASFVHQRFIFVNSIEEIFGQSYLTTESPNTQERQLKVNQKDINEINTLCSSLLWNHLTEQELEFNLSKDNPLAQLGETLAVVKEDIEELRESDAKQAQTLMDVFNSIQAGLIIVDAETHNILFVNEMAATMIGTSPDAIIGKLCHNFICSAEKGNCPITDQNMQIEKAERTLLRSDGSAMEVLKSVKPFQYQDRPCLLETFIDITEMKRVQSEREKNVKDLEENKVVLLSMMEDAEEARAETEMEKAKLVASEKRFRDITYSMSDFIWEVNKEGKFTYCSEKVEGILGYTPTEMLGKTPFDFMVSNETDKVPEIFSMIIANKKEIKDLENWNTKKDGQQICLLTNGLPILDEKGEFLGYRGVNDDITERKEAEVLIEQTRQNYETFFNTIDDFLFVLDEQGNIIHTNNTVLNRLEYSDDELIGKSVLMVHPEERREEAGRIVGEMLMGTAEFCPVPLVTKSGKQIAVETRVTQGIWNGNPVVFGVTKDISQVRLSEEKFSKVFYLNPSACGLSEINTGKYAEVNDAFYSLLGFDKNEVIGKTAIELGVFTQEAKDAIISKIGSDGKVINAESILRAKNGDIKNVLLSAENISVQDKNYRFTVVQDITERKQAETELSNKQALLRTIIDLIPDAIYAKDINGRKIIANKKEVYLSGKNSEEEVLGKTDSELYPDNIGNGSNLEEVSVLQTGTPIIDIEGKIKDINGKTRWLLGSKVPLRDTNGNIIGIVGVNHDITERKEIEEKLQESDLLFKELSKQVPGVIYQYQFHPDGRNYFPYASDNIWNVYEVTPEEVKTDATKVLSRVHHEDYDSVVNSILVSFETLNIWDCDYRVDLPTKGIRWLRGVAKPQKQEDGSVLWFGYISDITDKKEEEARLQWNESFLRLMSNTSPLAFFVVDNRTDKILYSNHRFCEIWGITHLEEKILRGELTNNEIIPDCLPVLADIPAFAESCKPLQFEENRITIEDFIPFNDGRTIRRFSTQMRGVNDEYFGRFYIFEDVTERKQSEEALEQITTRLSLATRTGGVGVWDYDLVNNNLFWDDQMFKLYGIEKNAFSGVYEAWQSGLHPEDKESGEQEVQMAISGEKEFDTEFRVVWPDGSVHNIKALAIVQRDDTGKPLHMIGTNWDITEQKQREEELQKLSDDLRDNNLYLEEATVLANKMAQDAEMANKSKSMFLANMSHEIRTPLNAIIGFSQLMNRDKQLSESQKEYNLLIIKAGEHLLMLINDILELSKVEAGRVVLNPTNVDLYSLLGDIEMIFKERAKSKHLQFTFETDNNLPRYVLIDEGKLRQIFVNLIGNAIKFTDVGEIVVRAHIVKVNEDRRDLIVEIEDTGAGIQENEINQLFQHFVQTSSGIKKGSGTGLGLALSRELAVLMGGDIVVASSFGKGSTFTFNVAIAEGEMEVVEENTSKRIICIDNNEKPYRILVVDDKEENLQVAVAFLQLVGFETNEAINGEDAIIKFEEWNPDLILMDIRMPIMDGYEATRQIKLTEKGAKTPIVALTASAFEEDKVKTKTLGMAGYIRKPFKENELFNVIGKVLDVKYIYEEQQIVLDNENYFKNDEEIFEAIAKLPQSLVINMSEALAVADLDLLIELIKSIESENSEIAQLLLKHTNNFDYKKLQELLNKNGEE